MRAASVLFLVVLLCLSGCSSQKGTQNPQQSAAPENSTTPTASTSSVAASFTDISGSDSAQAINDLAALGVFTQTTGAFNPDQPIMRSEFVEWLIKANNAIVQESQYHIHLAPSGEKPTFVDMPTTNPYFRYVQGLADAGYVIGVDATHFAPDKPLTREQMIGITASVNEHSNIPSGGDSSVAQFSDASQIGYKFIGAISEDGSARTTQTFSRVYGSTKMFRPLQDVTRGEAAVALSKMRGEWNRSAAEALGRTAPP